MISPKVSKEEAEKLVGVRRERALMLHWTPGLALNAELPLPLPSGRACVPAMPTSPASRPARPQFGKEGEGYRTIQVKSGKVSGGVRGAAQGRGRQPPAAVYPSGYRRHPTPSARHPPT